MLKGLGESFGALADVLANYWWIIIGVCLLVMFILVVYVLYLFLKSYFGVVIPVNETVSATLNVTRNITGVGV